VGVAAAGGVVLVVASVVVVVAVAVAGGDIVLSLVVLLRHLERLVQGVVEWMVAVRVLLLVMGMLLLLLLLVVLMVVLLGRVVLVVHPFSFFPRHPLGKGVGVAVVVGPVYTKEGSEWTCTSWDWVTHPSSCLGTYRRWRPSSQL